MRSSSRVLGALFFVALLVIGPNVLAAVTASAPATGVEKLSATPSKVCHPKKPITCRAAADLVTAALEASAVGTQPNVSKAAADPRVQSQQAILCGPWIKYMCYGGKTLS